MALAKWQREKLEKTVASLENQAKVMEDLHQAGMAGMNQEIDSIKTELKKWTNREVPVNFGVVVRPLTKNHQDGIGEHMHGTNIQKITFTPDRKMDEIITNVHEYNKFGAMGRYHWGDSKRFHLDSISNDIITSLTSPHFMEKALVVDVYPTEITIYFTFEDEENRQKKIDRAIELIKVAFWRWEVLEPTFSETKFMNY